MGFTRTTLRKTGADVHRLGLALNYGMAPDELPAALDRGVNYLFWTKTARQMKAPLKDALKRDRESLVLATGPSLGWFGGNVRRGCESILKELEIEYIDVFHLFWLGKMSAWTRGTVDALLELREEGKVKSLAVSIHDRPRAGELAEDSPLDLLMVRYNAAHPGAERDIFPKLDGDKQLVAYTATCWRRLLKAPAGWTEPVPTAGDCYRFALTNEHVSICLNGPASLGQLDENLAALEKGPMDASELAWMRRLGERVHGKTFDLA